MKKTTKDLKSPTATAPTAPRPVGAPRKFKKEDYFELKDALSQLGHAEVAVQQTIELAKAAVDQARAVRGFTEQRLNKLRARHSLPEGNYAFNDDECKFQRME